MTKTVTITMLEEFDNTDDCWCRYGRWLVVSSDFGSREIACVVGVPDYLRGTAAAAGTWAGVTTAWFADASDWRDLGLSLDEGAEALDVMREGAAAISDASKDTLLAGVAL